MRAFSVILLTLLTQSFASADFGEIDIIVRESVENYFSEAGKKVDMSKFEYYKVIDTEEGAVLKIESNVWAEQQMIHPNWGWHECLTQVQIKDQGQYEDLGTDCFFDFD